MGPTEVSQLEQAFNNQFGSSPPPAPAYSHTPPPYNPNPTPNPTPNPAYENPYVSPSGSGGSPWKMISIILIGLMAIGAGYYFLTKDNAGTEKTSNDGSILSSNAVKREEPIVKIDTPKRAVAVVDTPTIPAEDPAIAVAAEKEDRSQKIQRLISAEDNRNIDGILSMFDANMLQYWDMKNPSNTQLRNRYMDAWSKTDDVKHKNVRIHRVSKNTYDINGDFSYYSLKEDTYKSVPIKTRVIFNDEGKIIRTYGLNK